MRADTFILNTVILGESLEERLEEGEYNKISFKDFEKLINKLFPVISPDNLAVILSYKNKITDYDQIFHLSMKGSPKISCRDLIESLKVLISYFSLVDCSELLKEWNPTESYYPFLVFVLRQDVYKNIDFDYWEKVDPARLSEFLRRQE